MIRKRKKRRVGFHVNLMEYLKDPYPGINAIQVFLGRPISFWPSKYTEKQIQLVLNKSKELNLKIYVHTPYVLSILNHYDKTINALQQYQKLCKSLNIQNMVVHSGTGNRDKLIKTWLEIFSKINNPSMILLENLTKGATLPLQDLEYIAKETNCGICIDTAHLYTSGDNTIINPKYVKLVHANVCRGERGSKIDKHTKWSISEGDSEWAKNKIREFNCNLISEVNLSTVNINQELQTLTSLIS